MINYPFWPYPMDPHRPRNKHEARFWAIHAANPRIYLAIDAHAQDILSQGRSHYGVDLFFSSIRWDTGLSMEDETYKMNNDLRAYYARYWLQNHEENWDFFELRRVHGEHPWKLPPAYDSDGQALLW